ncbi:hypothetical protein NE237_020661 [Protea cynaroides]|uniref:F-box protein n=1 Tax=Protea cynaroides TaxID=273540 RepID=A0A9Q0K2I6_9MAGN|nr:hypothetical protein NE237_020661 [Protea cynaroides]
MVNGEEGDRKIPLMGFDQDDNIIVGSCNGFLCIANRFKVSPIYLCNPIFSGDNIMMLPKSHRALGTRCLIAIWKRYGEIMTVGESLWIKLVFPRKIEYSEPLFLDGILYWLIFQNLRSLIHDRFSGSLAIVDIEVFEGESIKSMDIWSVQDSKTMGFSFNLTTYDLSRLRYPLHKDGGYLCFLVLAKVGLDSLLMQLRWIENFAFVLYT